MARESRAVHGPDHTVRRRHARPRQPTVCEGASALAGGLDECTGLERTQGRRCLRLSRDGGAGGGAAAGQRHSGGRGVHRLSGRPDAAGNQAARDRTVGCRWSARGGHRHQPPSWPDARLAGDVRRGQGLPCCLRPERRCAPESHPRHRRTADAGERGARLVGLHDGGLGLHQDQHRQGRCQCHARCLAGDGARDSRVLRRDRPCRGLQARWRHQQCENGAELPGADEGRAGQPLARPQPLPLRCQQPAD